MFSLLGIPNVRLLFFAQALGVSASSFNVLLGGIVGTTLAPDPRLATLPVALAIVGVALGTVPVALMMRRHGRRFGFVFAASTATAGALLAAIAIQHGNFWLFAASTALLGFNLAAVQQYRFAATENVEPADAPRVVSLVLLGTLIAAFLGPFLAERAEPALGLSRFATAYLMLAGVIAVSVALLARYRNVAVERHDAEGRARPLRDIFRQRTFVVAALAAAIGYGVMTFLMTATPIAMHVIDNHSMGHTALVIQLHISAMYLPSLVSGTLIQRFGEGRLMLAGLAVLFACIVLASLGRELVHYGAALILLGIGWNFLFISGTTLLTRAWQPGERFRMQAANDFLVFSVTAIASLASGAAVHALGWEKLLVIVVPLLLLMALVVIASLGRLRAQRA